MDGYADAQAGVKHDHAVGHAAHLDALEESVNRQIDADVQTLMDNMRELILLSRVCMRVLIRLDRRQGPFRRPAGEISA